MEVMYFGLCIPNYGRTISVDSLRSTAQRAEALGFDSLWVSDHVFTPQHLLPRIGPIFYDAFVVLTYAAAFTRQAKLGTTVIVVPYRNPLVVAKMLATLDVLSHGRVIFGAGVGGAPDEFEALGVPSHQRGHRTDEYLRLMIALWTQEPVNFKGRFFSFTDVRFQPKPEQKPHPPIWIGGHSEAALRRAVAIGEAWHPTSLPLSVLQEKITQLQHLAKEIGRTEGPAVTLHQSVRLAKEYTPTKSGEERRPGVGKPEQILEDFRRYQELGISYIVCNFASANFQELWERMEIFARDVMSHSR